MYQEIFRCSHVESALLSLSPAKDRAGLAIGHQACAVSVKCSLLWFNEAQGCLCLGQNWHRGRDVVSGWSCLPRAKKGKRRSVSSARAGTRHIQSALVCRVMGWTGRVKGICPFQAKSVTKYYLHRSSCCSLLTGQLSTIYHFNMGGNSMFERQNGLWSVFYSC